MSLSWVMEEGGGGEASLTCTVGTDVFGKRIRSFFYRHDLLEFFKVR